MKNLGLIIEAIRLSMDRHTSEIESDWSLANPARGNCHVSALVFRHYFHEARIMRGVTFPGNEVHYWNVHRGVTIDVTRDQFNPAVVFAEGSVTDATFETLNHTTVGKYQLLKARVESRLTGQTASR